MRRPDLRLGLLLPAALLLAGCAMVETRHALNGGAEVYQPVLGRWYAQDKDERCQIDIEAEGERGLMRVRCDDKPDKVDVLHFQLAKVADRHYAFVAAEKGRYQLAHVEFDTQRLRFALADPQQVAADVRHHRGTGWIHRKSVLLVLQPAALERFIAVHGAQWFNSNDYTELTRTPAVSPERPSSGPATTGPMQ